jgi:hypothetical protein
MIYKPNNLVEFGVGATWKFLSVDFGYGLNLSRNEEKGNTDYFDFQFHYYGRRLMFDIFLQNYTGFYLWDIETEKIHGIRPDLSVFQVGFLGEYLFNGKKFSSSAAFNQEEWQKKSAGSLLLGIGAYYSKISADSSFVLNSEIKDRQTSRGFQFGPSIGYAYTWVMKENFFVTVSMSIGVHVGFGTINGKRKTEVFPTVYPRLSAGYNGDKWALSLSFQNNSIYTSNPEAAEMNLDIAEFKLVYSRRFSFYPEIKNKTLKRLFK